MHETIVNAIGELYDGPQKSHNPVKSEQKARVPDPRVLFLFLQFWEIFTRKSTLIFNISFTSKQCMQQMQNIHLIPVIIFLIFWSRKNLKRFKFNWQKI